MAKKTTSTSPVPVGTKLDSSLPSTIDKKVASSIEETRNRIKEIVSINVEKALAPHIKTLEPLLTAADRIVIKDQAGEAKAADLAKQINGEIDAIEQFRDNSVRPLNDFVKLVNTQCKAVQEDAKVGIDRMRAKIVASRAEEQKRVDELNRKQAAQAERKGKQVPSPVQASTPNAVAGRTGQAVGKKQWVWKVKDESKIPDSYWMLNGKAINAAVKAGIHEIAGLDIHQEEGVSFR